MKIRRPEPESWPCALCGERAYCHAARVPADMPEPVAVALVALGLLRLEPYCDACIDRAAMLLDAHDRRN